MIFRKRTTASQLRHKVSLQEKTLTPDGYGGFSQNWATLAEIWVELRAMGGSEKLAGSQLEAALTHRVRMRYRADVRPQMRLSFEGRLFNIRMVLNKDERREELELLVEEGVAT